MERPGESTWLYNQPSEGIVKNWIERNKSRPQFGNIEVLDSAVLISNFFRGWDGSLDIKYGPRDVILTKDGPDVPSQGSELWQIWREYAESDEADPRNDPKMHLHRYSIQPDGKLLLQGSNYDWHRMYSLGIGLRDGKIDEGYRDDILPTQVGQTFIFDSEHPNNTNSHSIVITSDNHLILATRGQAVHYYAGYTAASVEQQTNPLQENSPFETYLSAISKLNSLRSELNLTVRPETLRLGAIFLEPDANCAAFLVVGKVEEESSQINPSIISRGRLAEFAPTPNSVWSLSLDQPDGLIRQFYNPDGFLWHGTARLRIVAALAYVHGYEEALDRLYRAYSTS